MKAFLKVWWCRWYWHHSRNNKEVVEIIDQQTRKTTTSCLSCGFESIEQKTIVLHPAAIGAGTPINPSRYSHSGN